MKKIFTLILIITIVSITGHAQTVDEVVTDHLKAVGAKNLETIKSMEAKVKMVDNENREVQMTYWLKRPGMVRTEILLGDRKAVQAYDGKTAWAILPQATTMVPQVLPETQANQVKDTFQMIENPLLNYKEKGHTVELLGKHVEEENTYFTLKLTKKGAEPSTMYIDTKTHLLHKMTVFQTRGQLKYPMNLVYDNYKEVSGVKINHKLSAFVRGRNIWVMDFEYLKPNVPVDDSIFKMPEK